MQEWKSFTNILLVFLLVPLKDLLNGPKHSLKRIPINADNPGGSHAFNTGLPGGVPNKGNLSEVVTFLELEYFLALLLCDEFALGDHVEFVALFALFHDVVPNVVVLLFQDVAQLLHFVRVDFGQEGHF